MQSFNNSIQCSCLYIQDNFRNRGRILKPTYWTATNALPTKPPRITFEMAGILMALLSTLRNLICKRTFSIGSKTRNMSGQSTDQSILVGKRNQTCWGFLPALRYVSNDNKTEQRLTTQNLICNKYYLCIAMSKEIMLNGELVDNME